MALKLFNQVTGNTSVAKKTTFSVAHGMKTLVGGTSVNTKPDLFTIMALSTLTGTNTSNQSYFSFVTSTSTVVRYQCQAVSKKFVCNFVKLHSLVRIV